MHFGGDRTFDGHIKKATQKRRLTIEFREKSLFSQNNIRTNYVKQLIEGIDKILVQQEQQSDSLYKGGNGNSKEKSDQDYRWILQTHY